MAHFLRGKQAGIQSDFSAGLGPEIFILDDVSVWLRGASTYDC
jgi:syntaxin-binding protein 5